MDSEAGLPKRRLRREEKKKDNGGRGRDSHKHCSVENGLDNHTRLLSTCMTQAMVAAQSDSAQKLTQEVLLESTRARTASELSKFGMRTYFAQLFGCAFD
eukprot:2278951-Amphidinium_carterae.1